MTVLTPVYVAIGGLFAVVALRAARDRTRARHLVAAAFWGVLAVLFVAGDALPPLVVGLAVIVLALLAGIGGVVRPAPPAIDEAARAATAQRVGAAVFVPALLIPAVTVAIVVLAKSVPAIGGWFPDTTSPPLVALAIACALALVVACAILRRPPRDAFVAAGDLVDAIGWPLLLPLVLATLGALFVASGTGDAVASIIGHVVPVDSRLACVAAYVLGMALFAMVMGNAFAAFPVITAGIGIPLLVMKHGAEPASLAALGMVSGYCGTLMTPMAANFNIVPAALLELRDQHAVIRAQVPTALALLACNVVLTYFIVFR